MAGNPLDDFEKRQKMCLDHLEKSGDVETMSPIFVRLLLVDACGAYEKIIHRAVDQRAKNSKDGKFVKYLGSVTYGHDRTFGAISAWKFLQTLNKSDMGTGILVEEKTWKIYEKLIQHRNAVAHGEETNISLDELLHMCDIAKNVPLAFAEKLRTGFS